MIDLREVRSVTEFQRNIKDYVGRLKEKKTPLVLTINGRAEIVVQDAESYQRLLEAKDRMDAIEGIKRGVESMKRQRGKPATEFFREFFAEKGIGLN